MYTRLCIKVQLVFFNLRQGKKLKYNMCTRNHKSCYSGMTNSLVTSQLVFHTVKND